MDSLSRFMDKISVDANGCYLWQSTIKKDGYGQFWMGKSLPAHRASYLLFKGEIPEGKIVCHTCDVKHCVNPHHIYAGTYFDNAADKENRGRSVYHRKVSDESVAEIKALRATGMKQIEIAKKLNISQPTVSAVLRGDRKFIQSLST